MTSIEPRIEILQQKKLVGKYKRMSFSNNTTFQLWQSFMPRRKEISGKVSNEMISMQVYHEPMRMGDFNQEFDKWAAIEVTDFENVPHEMDTFTLKGGQYAVFPYKGLSTDVSIFIYIFGTWLSGSIYTLDLRPHFEILGEKYRNNDPESEEEIWIPIKLKDINC